MRTILVDYTEMFDNRTCHQAARTPNPSERLHCGPRKSATCRAAMKPQTQSDRSVSPAAGPHARTVGAIRV